MNLICRFFWMMLATWWRPAVGLFDRVPLRFRVLPYDLDLNWHMTNSRYLSIMDIGRTDLMIRSGLGRKVFKLRWAAVLGSAHVRWRKELNPFDAYTLYTRVVGWDQKWIYIEQEFYRGETFVARGLIKGLFLRKGRSVPMQEVVDLLQPGVASPPLSEEILRWQALEESAKEQGSASGMLKAQALL